MTDAPPEQAGFEHWALNLLCPNSQQKVASRDQSCEWCQLHRQKVQFGRGAREQRNTHPGYLRESQIDLPHKQSRSSQNHMNGETLPKIHDRVSRLSLQQTY